MQELINRYVESPYRKTKDGDISRYGNFFVMDTPPVYENLVYQIDNFNTPTISKHTDAKDNYIGVCTTRMPQSRHRENQSLYPVSLIDGDPYTCYCSKPKVRPDMQSVQIHVDLAKETKISKIILRKRPKNVDRNSPNFAYSMKGGPNSVEIGRAMSKRLKIYVSQDSLNKSLVYQNDNVDVNLEYLTILLDTRAKFVDLIFDDTLVCENMGYALSLSNIEIYDENTSNVALLSKGANCTANSYNSLPQTNMENNWATWLTQKDLGISWTRIGYHDDPINWHNVEREKGVYSWDPETDKAIDYLNESGVNIIWCIGFGNRLYEGNPDILLPQLPQWYYENPRPPVSKDAIDGFLNFVKETVNRYKGKVKCWEIWNEWNGQNYWGDVPNANNYISLMKKVIPLIRQLDPDGLIVLGSFDHFTHGYSKEQALKMWELYRDSDDEGEMVYWRNLVLIYQAIDELAPLVDGIGYHPFYQPDPECDDFVNYPQNITQFKQYCRDAGFTKDLWFSSEFAVGANYPYAIPGDNFVWWGKGGKINYTEIGKAKMLLSLLATQFGENIVSCYCELSNYNYPLELSLFKVVEDTYPVQSIAPSVAYYAMRNIANATNGYKPAYLPVNLSNNSLTKYTFVNSLGERMLMYFIRGNVGDDSVKGYVDINLGVETNHATLVDTLNGREIDLMVDHGKIHKVLMSDIPLLIKY